jgi:hypothetical protein
MKFYCRECEIEFSGGAVLPDCPVCGATKIGKSPAFVRVPDRETVSQWEARKGRQYPGTAPVYGRIREDDSRWCLRRRENAADIAELFVAAEDGLLPLPNDRKPK